MIRPILRDADTRVGFAELFFDLVFVFAITQVSHLLLHHYSLAGALETALIFLAIWWVWIYTTWVLNRLDPERIEVRGLLFALMAAGLFLSMSIPQAFGERGLTFALAFIAMQLGRSLFMFVVSKGNALLRGTYLRIAIWFCASAVFWIAGALADPHHGRLQLWAIALAIEYAGPLTGLYVPGLGRDTTTNWTVKGGHIAERCGLFVIICLGETLLVSGATFSGMEWTTPGTVAFLSSLAGAIGLWWVYFHVGFRRGAHQIEHSDDPGRLARLAFTYAHIPIVAGIVLTAVGAERSIAHPADPANLAEAASVLGGVAMFLAGNGWFKRISGRNFPLSHLVGLGLCVALMLVLPWMNLLALNIASTTILVLVAIWEQCSVGRHLDVH
ncbi:low temperature requirement protein A [Gemmobacter aquaticus]|uniref:low temperature requirement protein A n=1 Tax=Gemmobacter aquaticus TaxID=490185 RepID=UPI0011B4BB61|nr:low temperature requirement protein A [Gemmobacter aquaticus]